jgi:alcohol dehydrogenase class IV
MPPSLDYDFRVISYPYRVYSGKNALDHLPAEVKRHGARRPFVICGRSVSQRTDLVQRLSSLLGGSLAGIFDTMGKDTPLADVLAARDAARAARADILLAVGAGSVVQGARVVAIMLAEEGAVEKLATQYPADGGPAISPKLMTPKLPIINVLTAGTSAQNRAGSPAKAEGLDHRLEFFDPKTRPVALFWDEDALSTAPASMIRASYGAILWRAVMNMGYTQAPPLVDFNRRQVFEMMMNDLPRLKNPDDAKLRLNLCLATYLQNLDTDQGGLPAQHWVARVVYAFAASTFNLHEQVSQGDAHCAYTPAAIRKLGSRDPEEMRNIASALGVWREGDPIDDAPLRAAERLEEIFQTAGLPVKVSDLDLPLTAADAIFASSLKNFNADPKQTFRKEPALIKDCLLAAW